MKRHKKSKFDPYIDEIKSYLECGVSVNEIATILDERFDEIIELSALYSFIKNRGIRLPYQGGKSRTYTAPMCDSCENCHEVLNTNNNMQRICYSSRLISRSCLTSPQWCPRRERRAV